MGMHTASGSQYYSTAAPPVFLLPARMHRISFWFLRAGNGTDGDGAAESCSCSGPSMNFQTNLLCHDLTSRFQLRARGRMDTDVWTRRRAACRPWAAGRRRGGPASRDPRARASRLLWRGERQAGERGPGPTVATVAKRRVRSRCAARHRPGRVTRTRGEPRDGERSGSPLPWRGT
jgi:hypothetical protein